NCLSLRALTGSGPDEYRSPELVRRKVVSTTSFWRDSTARRAVSLCAWSGDVPPGRCVARKDQLPAHLAIRRVNDAGVDCRSEYRAISEIRLGALEGMFEHL